MPTPRPVVHEVTTQEQAKELALALLDPRRTRPVVVTTAPARMPRPYADPEVVVDAVAGLADVYVMPTGPVSYAFGDALPERTQVYGGAARVYPVDRGWVTDPYQSPLRFALDPGQGPEQEHRLITDALSMARHVGLRTPASPAATRAVGTVSGFVAGRGVVELRGASLERSTIWPELISPDLAIEQLLRPGMEVAGVLDPGRGRLDVSGEVAAPEVALAAYVAGATVLGQVTHVEAGLAVLRLYPDVEVGLDPQDALGDPGLDLRTVLPVGEVLSARGPGEEGDVLDLARLREVVAPHLRLHRATLGSPHFTRPAPPEERPVVGPGELTALLEDNRRLVREVERARGEAVQQRRSADQLRSQLRRHQEQIARLGRRSDDAAQEALAVLEADGARFADPERQFRFEVELAWARRTTPGEKDRFGLARWSIGPTFLSTLEEVGGVDRAKVVDVVVEVLTGQAETLHARQLHKLRTGDGGSDPPVTRADGAVCWRAYLQYTSPSARRLPFWRLRDASVELSSVRLHDDTTP